ncbi:MAG TPA: hypothetical protein VFR23_04815 [Jiangellaceae bacterium]|nr:hypothetical protein [Jiangellaceae bacterium]
MSKITAFVNVISRASCRRRDDRDEDCRGDFQYGGWAAPYALTAAI